MIELQPQLVNGARRTGDLVETLGISRAALKKAYARESNRILRLGRARATRYAARQALPGLDADQFPVFRVSEDGQIEQAGTLHTLAATESVWLPDERIIDGLPPEMQDVAPSGFLGRSFARRHNDLGLPEDVTAWSDPHVLSALVRRGEDLPGNLVIGRESFDRYQDLQHKNRTPADFAALSEAALAGEHAGSSAGGEQPKFTAYVDGRHRIVKFATDVSDNARRWQDLLALEHLALQTLRDAGLAAAHSELVDQDGLRCLVVERFDRLGADGRRALVSLACASGQANGSWSETAARLHESGAIRDADRRNIALLDAFGAQIANTDRHQYNLHLFSVADAYELAPAYDQLPMAYAPPASGNLRNTAVPAARPSVDTLDVWKEACEIAAEFWRRASDVELTEPMARIAQVSRDRARA